MITIDQLLPRPLVLPSLAEFPPDPAGTDAPGHPLVPLVLYDAPQADHRARQLIASLTRSSPQVLVFDPVCWNFDRLAHPVEQGRALADAAESNLLIVSTCGEADLPAAVNRWLETCLAGKKGSGTTVIALFGAPGRFDEPDAPRLHLLEAAARAAELDFFYLNPHSAHLPPLPVANLHAREEVITPTLAGILHRTPEASPEPNQGR